MLYRIITENKNRSDILTLLQRHFNGFTMYRATGVYTDKVGTHIEPALIIEIDDIGNERYSENGFQFTIKKVVSLIKIMNEQDCIFLQKIETKSELL